MRYLALDVGDRTIGLAVGEETFGLARPLKTIRRRGVAADLASLREIVSKEDIGSLVIGLPLTLRGEDGYQAGRVRTFAESARSLALPIELVRNLRRIDPRAITKPRARGSRPTRG